MPLLSMHNGLRCPGTCCPSRGLASSLRARQSSYHTAKSVAIVIRRHGCPQPCSVHAAPILATLGLKALPSRLAGGASSAQNRIHNQRPRLRVLARSSNVALQYGHGGSAPNRPQPWQVVSGLCGVALLLANFHRSVFTALLPALSGGLGLGAAEVGLVQSAMLWGYLAGQIPAGRLADEMGGERVLLAGLALWSLATATTAAAAAAPAAAAVPLLLAARAAMGLFSAAIMPGVAAAVAQWVPSERRGGTLAMIYAFFNLGGVLGLIVAPHMASRGMGGMGSSSSCSNWPSAFITAAAGGLMWALFGSAVLRRLGPSPLQRQQAKQQLQQQQEGQGAAGVQQQEQQQQQSVRREGPGSSGGGGGDGSEGAAATSAAATSGSPHPPPAVATTGPAAAAGVSTLPLEGEVPEPGPSGRMVNAREDTSPQGSDPRVGPDTDRGSGSSSDSKGEEEAVADRRSNLVQVAALCWCHLVIGWGFFVLQGWLPLYMQRLGVADLGTAGLLSSLPWLAAAFTATAAAGAADRLIRSGRASRLAVRRAMHAVSTLGCAAAVLPLAAAPSGALGAAGAAAAAGPGPLVATACLVAAVGCYGCSFGGFHAYVQDVASSDAGALLGLTNTASILGGIAGNLATGALLQSTGGYGAMFWLAAALYGTSWLVFTWLLRGQRIRLAGLIPPGWGQRKQRGQR